MLQGFLVSYRIPVVLQPINFNKKFGLKRHNEQGE